MQIVLIILIVVFALGALAALVRGIVSFLQTTEAELKSDATGPSLSSRKQNKMMFMRVGFQAAAVFVCILLLALKPH